MMWASVPHRATRSPCSNNPLAVHLWIVRQRQRTIHRTDSQGTQGHHPGEPNKAWDAKHLSGSTEGLTSSTT